MNLLPSFFLDAPAALQLQLVTQEFPYRAAGAVHP